MDREVEMMMQAEIDFGPTQPRTWTPAPTYTLAQARAAGADAGERAAKRAERDDGEFRRRAEAFVLAFLSQHATASGEEITDAAKRAGIVAPDSRAFGPVFASLSRNKRIACLRSDLPRSKGHGTSGGRLWRLVR